MKKSFNKSGIRLSLLFAVPDRNVIVTILAWIMLSVMVIAHGQARDLNSDTWVATDALGRTLPGYEDVGPKQDNKYVGMFYFLWHGARGSTALYDNTKLLAENPTNPDYGPLNSFHWWGEPEAGYYKATDPWVIRRNASMLTDAGVDVIFLDATNGFTYQPEYTALCDTYTQIRNEGGKTPQIAFITHRNSADTINTLYDDLYSKELYSDLWFRWDGKPTILGYPDSNNSATVQNFFTFRESWAWQTGENKWPWIDTYPQTPNWHDDPSIPEQIPVAVASHPLQRNIGTSYHDGQQPAIDQYGLCSTTGEGQNFAEQWDRALEVMQGPANDPQLVFVTSWNEWIAQRFIYGITHPTTTKLSFLGKPLVEGETYFVDSYNEEYNRDIEPMKDGHTDNYYYQLVSNIRQYKGVDAPQAADAPTTITIGGDFAQWNQVALEYRDTIGDTEHRDHDGWGGLHYTNTTGRNDFVTGKVVNDCSKAYFYIETQDDITDHTDDHWMMLFIDSDLNSETGWNGYDYVVNMDGVTADKTTLKKVIDEVTWVTAGILDYFVSDNMMEIAVPLSLIDQDGDMASFNFHWADNMQEVNDITQFFINGDSAPNRRFDYHYTNIIPVPEPATVCILMAGVLLFWLSRLWKKHRAFPKID